MVYAVAVLLISALDYGGPRRSLGGDFASELVLAYPGVPRRDVAAFIDPRLRALCGLRDSRGGGGRGGHSRSLARLKKRQAGSLLTLFAAALFALTGTDRHCGGRNMQCASIKPPGVGRL